MSERKSTVSERCVVQAVWIPLFVLLFFSYVGADDGKAWAQEAKAVNDIAFPDQMQGDWVAVDQPGYRLSIEGSTIEISGSAVVYDYKQIIHRDGALTVELEVNDPAQEDDFQRQNITGLVITPEGEFFAYNVKFSVELVRPQQGHSAKP